MTQTLVSAVLAVGLLGACRSTVELGERMPSAADVPEGHGSVIGSILISTPTDVSDEARSRFDALRSKRLVLEIGRFVEHDLGIGGWVSHPGETYSLVLEVGVEKPFVLTAPAGSYSFQVLATRVDGWFGDENECSMYGLANFEVRAESTTYIGRLEVAAGIPAEEEERQLRLMNAARHIDSGYTTANPADHPELSLVMKLHCSDTRESTLRTLGVPSSTTGMDTALMFVGRPLWGLDPKSPPPKPPGQP
jgi:hypothetical protein